MSGAGVTLNFDATNVQPAAALDPIPSGWYNCIMTESEMKPTEKPGGMYLETTMQVMDGAYAGRKVFDRLNLQNANPIAVEIAYKQLSAICHAVGVIQVANSQQLHNRPMQVKVSLRQGGINQANGVAYDAYNEVKGYKAIEATTAAAPIAPPVPPAPAGASAAPWAPPVAAASVPVPQPAAPAWAPPPAAPAPAAPPAWTPPPAPVATAPVAAAPGTPPWAVPAAAAPGAPAAPPWAKK